MNYDLVGFLFKAGRTEEARLLDEECIQDSLELFGPKLGYTRVWVANYKTRWQAMKETDALAPPCLPRPAHEMLRTFNSCKL